VVAVTPTTNDALRAHLAQVAQQFSLAAVTVVTSVGTGPETPEELEAHLAHLHANRRAAFIQMTVRVDAVVMMRFITSNIAFQHALIQLAESCANGQLVSEQLASELANFCARVRFAWW
jgi:hypothetical protein